MTILNTTFFFAPNIEEEGLSWINTEYLPLAQSTMGGCPVVMKVHNDVDTDGVAYAVQLSFSSMDDARAWADKYAQDSYATLAEAWPEMAFAVQTMLEVLD